VAHTARTRLSIRTLLRLHAFRIISVSTAQYPTHHTILSHNHSFLAHVSPLLPASRMCSSQCSLSLASASVCCLFPHSSRHHRHPLPSPVPFSPTGLPVQVKLWSHHFLQSVPSLIILPAHGAVAFSHSSFVPEMLLLACPFLPHPRQPSVRFAWLLLAFGCSC